MWREGLRQQLHLLHCTQLNSWNLCKQKFWISEHPCCKESWQNGMKSRHSQETVIKCALEGRKVAPANMCRCVYMDAGELCGNPIYHHIESEHLQCLVSCIYLSARFSSSALNLTQSNFNAFCIQYGQLLTKMTPNDC